MLAQTLLEMIYEELSDEQQEEVRVCLPDNTEAIITAVTNDGDTIIIDVRTARSGEKVL